MTTPMTDPIRIAAAQIAPVWLNRDATLARVVECIDRAATDGAQLVAFGECLVPGYPWWIERTDGVRFDSDLQKTLFAHYVDQAVDLDAGHLAPVLDAAQRGRIAVVLGILERPAARGESVYASAVSIGADGEVRAVQRKLMPTWEERLVWAIGDGHGLRTWRLSEFTVGALNCWENWMPLARASLQAQGEDLHVAIWPGNARNTAEITRFMALEGRSYVLSVSGLMRADDFPQGLPCADALQQAAADMPWAAGGSCIVGPDGEWLLEPVEHDDGVFIVEIDHRAVRCARHNFDPSGHYSRPDVFTLNIDRRRQRIARFDED
jgi:nitrilase